MIYPSPALRSMKGVKGVLAQRNLREVQGIVEDALVEYVEERSEDPAMKYAKDILLAGGKRFRPVLGCLAYEAAGATLDDKMLRAALSMEIIHTATLVHDDIYDQAKLRRGRPTLHSQHGLAHGIISGDYLFTLGYWLGAEQGQDVIRVIAEACVGLANGELLQFDHIGDLGTSPEDYYRIIDGKTAGPIAAGCKVAGMVANAGEDIIDALETFGWEVGRAFQMVDDLLDLTGNPRMGKPRGTDIYEGKMTLPIIHALTTLHGNDRENLEDVLMDFSEVRWDELIDLLETSGSINYVRSLIDSHIQRAVESLTILPNSSQIELMIEFARKSAIRSI